MNRLNELIASIADCPFQTIVRLAGVYNFPHFEFKFIKIQGSAGANPGSIAVVRISSQESGFPDHLLDSQEGKFALADFLVRRFRDGIDQFAEQNRGKDGSGSFGTIDLSQKMLSRDTVLFEDKVIALKFIISLPGKGLGGGIFDADQAWIMLNRELVAIVDHTFFYQHYDEQARTLLGRFFEVQKSRSDITQFMQQHDLVSFIANRASLPRHSGIDDRPALGEFVSLFQSPDLLEIEVPLTNGNSMTGMGIKAGITVITGGSHHGKSTLLQAILAGIYAHIPGDGREYVVTREDAFLIRAEEGRSVQDVDISGFISNLPNGVKTSHFSSFNASGSTSQAANMVEAIEIGCRLLLFDEDSSASNFLVRDELINQVLEPLQEPIKPLYNVLMSLWHQYRISMIFVLGGLGHFLQKASTCLLMENYRCHDITAKVRKRLGVIPYEESCQFNFSESRRLAADNFNPTYHNQRLKKTLPKRIKLSAVASKRLEYGMDVIDLEAIAQLAEAPQVLTIGFCLLVLRNKINQHADKPETIKFWIDWLDEQLSNHGLSYLTPDYPGLLSRPRKYELAAAINRIRSLKIHE